MLDMGETGMPVPELCREHGISSVTKNLPDNDFGLITMSARIRRLEDTINAWIDRYYDPEKFLAHIEEKYELDRDGFYHWDGIDRKSIRLNSSHVRISYAVFCLKKKK